MKNILALAWVTAFLVACGTHVYRETEFHPRQTLMSTYPAYQYDVWSREGRAFRD